MSSLAEELITRNHEIVQRWYERWRHSPKPHPNVTEAALKDSLAEQLVLVGRQLLDLRHAEDPAQMWQVSERLDPESRITQDIPIEEVVLEYRFAVDVVRSWIQEHHIDVEFAEYSFFFQSMFELAAESVRRYAMRQVENTRDRATYLAAVMHQLRTPLSTLATLVAAHDRRCPDAAAVQRMKRSVHRISFLVEGVLRLERFKPDQMPVRPVELAPYQVIDEIMSDYERDAADKKLRFEARIDRSMRMTTDPDLFTDVIGNLVQNAIRFTSTGYVFVEAEGSAADVEFRVRDSGPGIPEPIQEALFRVTQPGTAGGSGIGLRIAYRAVRALGGDIGVTSGPGGSQFWVRLPWVVTPRPEPDAPAGP